MRLKEHHGNSQWLPLTAAIPVTRGCSHHYILTFRYDRFLRPLGEFVLWWRSDLQGTTPQGSVQPKGATARVRWYSDDGRVLTWDSDPKMFELVDDDRWHPLRFDFPVQPCGCAHLQFAAIVTADTEATYHGALMCDLVMPPIRCTSRVMLTAQRRLGTDSIVLRTVGSCSEDNESTSRAKVTAVVTSCGRQDLLKLTLDSFLRFNTFPLAGIIVVEDGPGAANRLLVDIYADKNVTWLATDQRVGQIVAIDYAYSFVDTEYVFHLEDDWEFHSSGFIEKSLKILMALPGALQVYLRALNDLNGHPLRPPVLWSSGVPYREVEFAYINLWHGFSFNPGLRRTSDYRLLGQYSRHVRHDYERSGAAEAMISSIYRTQGRYAVALADNSEGGYVRHIGDSRRVA